MRDDAFQFARRRVFNDESCCRRGDRFDSPAPSTSRVAGLALSCRRYCHGRVSWRQRSGPPGRRARQRAIPKMTAPRTRQKLQDRARDAAKSNGRPYRPCLCAAPSRRCAPRKATAAPGCRPWARSMTAISRWFGWRKCDGPRRWAVSIFVNPTQFAPHEDLGSLSAHLEGRHRQTRRREGPILSGTRMPRLMYPPEFASRVAVEGPATVSLEDRVPAAFLRRRGHRCGQAVHPGATGRGDLRREGFPAAQGGHPHGARPRPRRRDRRRGDRARA